MEKRLMYYLEPADLERIIDELKAHISSEIQAALHGRSVEQTMSVKEAAKYLGVNLHTFQSWSCDGTIPNDIVHWIGKRKVFIKSELAKAIREGKIKSKLSRP